jgi:hypothetical protein
MAGNFAELYEANNKMFGVTHGCGCCSVERTITRYELEEHIKSLEEDISIAKEYIERLFGTAS